MKKSFLRKIVTFISVISIIAQSFTPYLVLLPQQASAQTVTETSTPTPTDTITPTPPDTATPTPTDTITPTSTDTPTPTDIPTDTITPTPTDTPTPTGTAPVTNNSPPSGDGTSSSNPSNSSNSSTTPASNAADATETSTLTSPTASEGQAGDEQLSLVILDNVSAPSIDLDSVTDSDSASLTTDKTDYSPTDTALITGRNFNPNETYTLIITSVNNYSFSTFITADESGNIAYAYQLDGTYRPTYTVQVKDGSGTVVASTTFTDSPTCSNDAQGANDEPGQKDLTRMCADYAGLPNTISINWDWDEINGDGANTFDACSLYDTDNDGKANYSACVTVTGSPLVQAANSPRIYSCDDANSDKCSGDTLIAGPYVTTCSTAQQNTDPFPSGTANPNDTVATCTIKLSEVGGATSKLLDVCSYPSQIPHSDPSDCIIASTESQNGTVELKKVWSGTGGQTTLQIGTSAGGVDIASQQTGVNGAEPLTTGAKTVNVGTYYVSESEGLTDYTPSLTCTKNGNPYTPGTNNSLIVGNNDIFVCTFTNTRINNGSITLDKVTSPTQDPTSFSFTTSNLPAPTTPSLTDITTPVTWPNLAAGNYSITENTTSGWSLSSVSCTDNTTHNSVSTPSGFGTGTIALTAGENVTCTFTNTRDTGTVTVTKALIPPQDPGTFNLQINGTTYATGGNGTTTGAQTLSTGSVTVGETGTDGINLSNYTTSIVCQNAAGAPVNSPTFTLNKDDNITCTITNTRKTGTVELEKHWVGTPGSTILNIGTTVGTGDVDTQTVNGVDATTGQNTVNTGTYYLSESTGLTNYTTSPLSCFNDVNNNGTNDTEPTVTVGASDSIAITNGQHVICTYNNTRNQGTIELKKAWSGTAGQTTLNIGTTAGGTQTASVQTGTNGDAPLTTGVKTVNTGTYYVSETGGLSNYGSSLSCIKNDNPVTPGQDNSLSVGKDDVVVCTFTNTRDTGTLQVLKNVDNNNDGDVTDPGDVTGATDWTWDIASGEQNIATGQSRNLVTGNYTITEDVNTDYHIVGWICTDQSSGSTNSIPVNLASNEQSITCTITNAINTGTVVVHKDVQGPNGEDVTDISNNSEVSLDGGTGQTITDNLTVTYNNVPVGSHTITESLVDSDYTLYGISSVVGTAGNTSGLTISVATGTNDVYVTNRQKTGTITVIKDVVNPDGGAVSDTHSFTVNLAPGGQSDSFAEGDNAVFTVNPGTYTASESADAAYTSLGCLTPTGKDDIVVASGGQVTITCTNRQNSGTIVVHKDVQGPNGEDVSDQSSSFEASLDGGTGQLIFDNNAHTYNNVLVGNHTITESLVDTDYTLYGISTIPGAVGTPTGLSVSVAGGQTVDVYVTNRQKSGTITVVKDVVNSNGGAVSDSHTFTVNLNPGSQSDSFAEGDNAVFTVNPGTYTASETDDANYTELGCKTATGKDDIVVGSGESVTVTCTNKQNPGTISGTKFDENQNVLAGWTINLFGCTALGIGCGITPLFTTVTGVDGTYSFGNLVIGFYKVVEVMQTGWTNVTSLFHDITINPGSTVTQQNFVNKGALSITACKYEDSNGTLQRGAFTTVNNWTFTLGSSVATTSANGCTTFTDLKPGTYTVTELPLPTGWFIADDSQGSRQVVLTDENETVNFYNYQKGSITGTKWSDADGDSEFGDEEVLSNWTIFIDEDENEELGSGETSTLTDQDGNYVLSNLDPGVYIVCEVVENGWVQTYPDSVCHEVTVTSGNESSDNDFGNQGQGTIIVEKDVVPNSDATFNFTIEGDLLIETIGFVLGDEDSNNYSSLPADTYTVAEESNELYTTTVDCVSNQKDEESADSLILDPGETITCTYTNTRNTGDISGSKFEDVNGNGIWDDGEPGLDGWTINLYTDDDEEPGDIVNSTETSDDPLGEYKFEGIPTGSYFVCEEGQDEWYQSAPNTNGGCYPVTLSENGEEITNRDFGNFQPIDVRVIKDVVDPSGNPVVDTSTQFDFVLGDHGFSLTDGGQATYGLNPGKYDVTETLNANYNFQGCTVSGGTSNNPVYDEEDNLIGVSVNVNSGDNEVTVTCTNRQKPGTITGTKWNDLNEDGIRDCELFDSFSERQFCESYTDPGLQNWHIQLFMNDDGDLGDQVGEDQITGSDGSYTFSDVAPGDYFVCEVKQTGWDQTYPNLDQDISNCWEITVDSNVNYSDKDFGNHSTTPILTISKVNDTEGNTKSPGDIIGFTITLILDVEGGSAENLKVIDLLPKGFVYVSGSWQVLLNGTPIAKPEPTYASPGTWTLGSADPGDIFTLKYSAKIDGNQQTGTYFDNAWGQGTALGQSDAILASADPDIADGNIGDPNFVGTQVALVNPNQPGVDYKVASTQEVLGASTFLPATGEDTLWVIIATLMLGLGFGTLITGYKLKKKYE